VGRFEVPVADRLHDEHLEEIETEQRMATRETKS